jgi:predicted transcriptional regulator
MPRTPVQQAILVDLLVFGDDKAANVGQRTSFHRNTVSKHLNLLEREGDVRNKGGGVYTLTDSGREGAQSLIRAGELPYGDESD